MRPMAWPAVVALAAACAAWGDALSEATSMRWSFGVDAEGWRVGASPIEHYGDRERAAALVVPGVEDGTVAVWGAPTERLFMDDAGLVRRGTTVTQWLLSPQLDVEAARFTTLRLRLRSEPGSDVDVTLQWLTDGGREALVAHRAALARLVLPDSVRAEFEAHLRGEVPADTWQLYMRSWENGEGYQYAQEARRLREEEILLRGWMEAGGGRLTGGDDWQDLSVDLRPLAGWRGRVIAVGLGLTRRPSAPDVLVSPSSPEADAFVWIDQVELSGSIQGSGVRPATLPGTD